MEEVDDEIEDLWREGRRHCGLRDNWFIRRYLIQRMKRSHLHGVGKARVSPARTVATSDRRVDVAIRAISNRYDLSLQFSYFAPRMQEGIARKDKVGFPVRQIDDRGHGLYLLRLCYLFRCVIICASCIMTRCRHYTHLINPDSNEGGVITPGEITGIELDPRHTHMDL